ncbi:MAG: HNH endonuclease signature motif containing protein, partial [Corynebacterium sp.]|nr:HNH endonuclease signature motif containing protein [Corynebacterium sp.]
ITLVHPYEGAVNLYRTERMASEKQRLMAAAENPVCPWPACNYPADKCQVHHLQAWRHGGETNMSNLATCCPYHNGVNDDDPNAPPVRGRLVRRRGRVVWQPPWADTAASPSSPNEPVQPTPPDPPH